MPMPCRAEAAQCYDRYMPIAPPRRHPRASLLFVCPLAPPAVITPQVQPARALCTVVTSQGHSASHNDIHKETPSCNDGGCGAGYGALGTVGLYSVHRGP